MVPRAVRHRLALLCAALLPLSGLACAAREPIEDLYPLPDFALTERSGATVHRDDLAGHVCIVSFIFTNCGGTCPLISQTMQGLQRDLADHPDIRLVSITVDPERDTPEQLREHADRLHADPKRWLFLTGPRKDIYHLVQKGFHLAVQPNEGTDPKQGEAILHSTRLVLVDREGHIRGNFEGVQPPYGPDPAGELAAQMKRLRTQAIRLQGNREESVFPAVNAGLNGSCVVLLVLGWVAIRQGLIRAHKVCMLTALAVSATFLASYLFFHLVIRHGQPTAFSDRAPDAPDWVKSVYYTILATHTLLAIVVTPMALVSAYFGLRDRIARHRALARWTMPVWLYVSVTGVVVYWMLYRLYPAG